MKNFIDFGRKIRAYRVSKDKSLSDVASSLGIDRTYLSKLENGHLQPSKKLLEKIIQYYDLNKSESSELYKAVGYGEKGINMNIEGEGVTRMEDKIPGSEIAKDSGAEVNVPANMPVLYTDSIFITSNPYGTTIDFATRLGTTNKHQVVARIGMSTQHLEKFIEILQKHKKNPGVEITRRVES